MSAQDTFSVAGRTFVSRLLVGTGKYKDMGETRDAIAAGAYSGLAKALFEMSPDDVIAEIEVSGQRGRGGAGFPTARKWRASKAAAWASDRAS